MRTIMRRSRSVALAGNGFDTTAGALLASDKSSLCAPTDRSTFLNSSRQPEVSRWSSVASANVRTHVAIVRRELNISCCNFALGSKGKRKTTTANHTTIPMAVSSILAKAYSEMDSGLEAKPRTMIPLVKAVTTPAYPYSLEGLAKDAKNTNAGNANSTAALFESVSLRSVYPNMAPDTVPCNRKMLCLTLEPVDLPITKAIVKGPQKALSKLPSKSGMSTSREVSSIATAILMAFFTLSVLQSGLHPREGSIE
mmetsp:Transcript_7667/g.10910  ORF Transcript_7667/g.10910 Transcript_7667/m.10910 type:complete len:254 (+) Transcript_7667:863-1624(+)